MQYIIDTYRRTKELHHAYFIEGPRNAAFSALTSFFENEVGMPTRGNPDFWHAEFETLGIDEGRLLKEMQMLMPVAGERKVFVIMADFMTREVQNSLLKVFEEPTAGTHFFLIMPSASVLLPTLSSRLVITTMQTENIPYADEAKQFLASSTAKRLELVKGFIENKDKAEAISFLNALEDVTRKACKGNSITADEASFLREIISCRSYMNDRAPSVKILLEHLALLTSRSMV